MPLIPGSLVACRSTASASARLIRRSQSHGSNSPPTCCRPSPRAPQPKTPYTDTTLIEVCSAKVRPRYFFSPSEPRLGTRHHLSGSLHSDLNVERVVTAVRRPWNGSYSEYSVRIPSVLLRNPPDVRRTRFDRRTLLGDNHCFP